MNKKKIGKDIEQFFKKYKISGICYSKEFGSFTMFNELPDKLMVLDSARGELMKRDKLLELETRGELMAIKNNEVPSYIG